MFSLRDFCWNLTCFLDAGNSDGHLSLVVTTVLNLTYILNRAVFAVYSKYRGMFDSEQ